MIRTRFLAFAAALLVSTVAIANTASLPQTHVVAATDQPAFV